MKIPHLTSCMQLTLVCGIMFGAASQVSAADPHIHAEVITGVGSSWQTITLPRSYSDPVVVATPVAASTSSKPVITRVRNAAASQFELQVHNPSGTTLSGIAVHVVVCEAGTYTAAADGITMEAGRFASTVTDHDKSWVGQPLSYANSYTNPVILGQVMSANAAWSVFWARGTAAINPPDASTAYIGKNVAEDPATSRANETLGYIVVEAGLQTVGGRQVLAGVGTDSVLGTGDAPPYTYTLSGLTAAPSAVVLSAAAMDGANGGWPVLFGDTVLTSSALSLAYDEDQLNDSERKHTAEQVAYLVLGPPPANQVPTAAAGDDQTIADSDAQPGESVTLDASASSDVDGSIQSYIWTEGATPVASGVNPTVTLSDGIHHLTLTVTDDDGATATDTVTVTVNAAVTPPSGPKLASAVVTGVGSTWQLVTLPNNYTEAVIVATPAYTSSDQPAVTRIRNITATSFELRVQNPGGATLSGITVRYIVAEAGTYTAASHGVTMEVRRLIGTATGGKLAGWTTQSVSYQQSYSAPVVLGQVLSATDASFSYFWANNGTQGTRPSASSLAVGKGVAEDSDTTRANETLGLIIIESGTHTVAGQTFIAGVGSDSVEGMGSSNPPDTYAVAGMPADPVAVLTLAGLDGGDGGWPVWYGSNPLAGGQLDLVIDEDTITDTERAHTTEEVAYLIMPRSAAASNQSPIASAGSDRVLADSDGLPGEVLQVDASGSTDADGSIVSYVWSIDATTYGTGVNPSLSLPDGDHTLTVTVTDDDGATATDTLQVSIGTAITWRPDQLAGLQLWLDAADPTQVQTVSGNRISTWSDKSGQNRHAVQSTDADRPVYNAITQSVELRGDAGNNTSGQFLQISDCTVQTVVVVTRNLATTPGTTHGLLGLSTATAPPHYLHVTSNAGADYAVSFDGAGAGWTGRYVVDGGSWSAVADNAGSGGYPLTPSIGVMEFANPHNGWNIIFAINNDSSQNIVEFRANLDCQEYLIFDRALTLAEQQALEGYLAHKWRLTAQLPGGHPYKNAAPVPSSNAAPIAHAGSDLIIADSDGQTGELVSLDASASSDSDGSIVSYDWAIAGSSIATGVNPSGIALGDGVHLIDLTVTDNDGATATDQVQVTIQAPVLAGGPKLYARTVSAVSDNWQTIALPQSYNDMVVIATPVLPNTSTAPIVTRIRQAAGNSFQLRVQNPSATALSGITVHILVADVGVYTAADHGVRMEVVKYNATVTDGNQSSWSGQARSYQQSYSSPVVLGQVLTANDVDFSTFWAYGSSRTEPPSATALVTGKAVAQDPDTTRANETIGYIAIESGTHSVDGRTLIAGLGSDTVAGVDNAPPYSYGISGMPVNPVAVLSMAALDGADGGWPVLFGSAPTAGGALDVVVDEDRLLDGERAHTTEQLAYLIMPNQQDATPVADAGADQQVNDDGDGHVSVQLDGSDSSDAEGPLAAYRWFQGVVEIGSTSLLTIELGLGVHELRLEVEDSSGQTHSDIVRVTVLPAQRIWLQADRYTIPVEGQELQVVAAGGVLANDGSPPGGGSWTAQLVSGPSKGTLSAFNADGSFTYTPQGIFDGTDRFTYRASGNGHQSEIATVRIEVATTAGPEHSSLIAPVAFDPAAFAADPNAYISQIVPARVWQQADPGPSVSRLRVNGSRYRQGQVDQAVTIQLQATANAPVTVHSLADGTFANGRNTQTVQCDGAGLASVSYTPVNAGPNIILAASPMTSGQVRVKVVVE